MTDPNAQEKESKGDFADIIQKLIRSLDLNNNLIRYIFAGLTTMTLLATYKTGRDILGSIYQVFGSISLIPSALVVGIISYLMLHNTILRKRLFIHGSLPKIAYIISKTVGEKKFLECLDKLRIRVKVTARRVDIRKYFPVSFGTSTYYLTYSAIKSYINMTNLQWENCLRNLKWIVKPDKDGVDHKIWDNSRFQPQHTEIGWLELAGCLMVILSIVMITYTILNTLIDHASLCTIQFIKHVWTDILYSTVLFVLGIKATYVGIEYDISVSQQYIDKLTELERIGKLTKNDYKPYYVE